VNPLQTQKNDLACANEGEPDSGKGKMPGEKRKRIAKEEAVGNLPPESEVLKGGGKIRGLANARSLAIQREKKETEGKPLGKKQKFFTCGGEKRRQTFSIKERGGNRLATMAERKEKFDADLMRRRTQKTSYEQKHRTVLLSPKRNLGRNLGGGRGKGAACAV